MLIFSSLCQWLIVERRNLAECRIPYMCGLGVRMRCFAHATSSSEVFKPPKETSGTTDPYSMDMFNVRKGTGGIAVYDADMGAGSRLPPYRAQNEPFVILIDCVESKRWHFCFSEVQ